MAEENRSWGDDRIVGGALANLGFEVSDQTVGIVLRRHRVPPAPERKRTTTWPTFILHLALLTGTDFFSAEVFTLRGLVTYYVLSSSISRAAGARSLGSRITRTSCG